MLQILDNDVYDLLEFIAAHNSPEQIEQAEKEIPEKDEIQEQSFELLGQYLDTLAEAKP